MVTRGVAATAALSVVVVAAVGLPASDEGERFADSRESINLTVDVQRSNCITSSQSLVSYTPTTVRGHHQLLGTECCLIVQQINFFPRIQNWVCFSIESEPSHQTDQSDFAQLSVKTSYSQLFLPSSHDTEHQADPAP